MLYYEILAYGIAKDASTALKSANHHHYQTMTVINIFYVSLYKQGEKIFNVARHVKCKHYTHGNIPRI